MFRHKRTSPIALPIYKAVLTILVVIQSGEVENAVLKHCLYRDVVLFAFNANATVVSLGNGLIASYTSPISGPFSSGQYDIGFGSPIDYVDPGETIEASIFNSSMNLLDSSSYTWPLGSSYAGGLGLGLHAPLVPDVGFVKIIALNGSFDITSLGLALNNGSELRNSISQITSDQSGRFRFLLLYLCS